MQFILQEKKAQAREAGMFRKGSLRTQANSELNW